MSKLTHVDPSGRPAMVDVSGKRATLRKATAAATVRLPAGAAAQLRRQDYATAKGPVFHTAIVAGTMAAKRTHELIPFCHPLRIEHCSVDLGMDDDGCIEIRCRVVAHDRTGVEMEALTGASIAALTVYDMCKSLSRDIEITGTKLLAKSGGRSGRRLQEPPQ